ncbi:MAG: THUMP domain-containing protein [Candidatus Woesearchaeota archaeon]|nr:THUMP domain-containing protein [Candidatus Woesearchaeota archaeon]
MEAVLITNPGIEFIAKKELDELIKPKNAVIEDSVVIFEPKEIKDLFRLCYLSQSAIRILLLIKNIDFSKKEDIIKALNEKDFSFIKGSFKVICEKSSEHEGNYDFTSKEIEEGIADFIKEKVDLDKPDVIIYAYLYGKKCYIGVDLAGFDLSKRQYRIFNYRDSLKANIAYAMLRIADYKPGDFLLDPFCGTGTIPIEAALYAYNFPVNYFIKDKLIFRNFKFLDIEKTDFDRFFEEIDKKIYQKKKTNINGFDSILGYVKAAQKNAKIAGIHKKIRFSRIDIEWIDTKLGEKSVDKIVTKVPVLSEKNKKEIAKIYKELFYQAGYILKKNGMIVVAIENDESEALIRKFSKEYGFSIKESIKAMQGKKKIKIIAIQK